MPNELLCLQGKIDSFGAKLCQAHFRHQPTADIMKQTTFEVKTTLTGEDRESQFAGIAARLKELPGVEDVEGDPHAVYCKFLIRVCFADADEAVRIHTAILGVFASDPSVQVVGLGTNVTEVFG